MYGCLRVTRRQHRPSRRPEWAGFPTDKAAALIDFGATRDWRQLLRETTGSDISAEPMLRYFAPLLAWLRRENAGRKATLPDL